MSGHRSSKIEKTVRDRVFDLFRAFGTTTIFGNPGSTELPMFRDFPNDFRYVLALQEMVAVGMADGYAQATRNAGLVNLHSAAGLGHALGAVFTAAKHQSPLVIIAGQQARSSRPAPRTFRPHSPAPTTPRCSRRRGPVLSRSRSTIGTAFAIPSNRAGWA